MFLALLLLFFGLAILIFGAELLVRGAASLARAWGVAPLVIGLTIVAFGTSAPELVVNIVSALRGASDIVIGNILGSNIFNILLILGIASLIWPLRVKESTVWKEIPFALLAMLILAVAVNDRVLDGASANVLSRSDALGLLGMLAIFLYYAFAIAKIGKDGEAEEEIKEYSLGVSAAFTAAGLLFLFFGGKLFVDQAVTLARLAGLSEALIGLTIVAAGTSLPELATSAVAAYRKHADIAVGNIVGSNIFNVFSILGITGLIAPVSFNAVLNVDVVVATAATILLFVVMFIGKRHVLERWQGGAMLALFLIYMVYVVARG
ncbi:MAG: calcium/sodium antiporter [Candidatus Niyogibacteria bacterium]|nr:calcium/sodium antiporter [Candidatus Niyogibacteria bacterium]